MKFGQNLHRYQIVEWAPFYINYQALKERYKGAIIHAVDRAQDADLRGLSYVICFIPDLTMAQNAELLWSKSCQK